MKVPVSSAAYLFLIHAPVAASFRRAIGGNELAIGQIAATLGYSRQYIYKQRVESDRKIIKQQTVKHLVDRERKLLPRLGTRKIYHLIQADLKELNLKFGRTTTHF